MIKRKVDALFISDVHLGSKGSNAKQLLETLKQYKPNHLFIVGDFIDGWLLKRRHYWTQDFTDVLRKILSYSKSKCRIWPTCSPMSFTSTNTYALLYAFAKSLMIFGNNIGLI